MSVAAGDPYFTFVAAAYGVSALVLLGLGAGLFLDARAKSRRLAALEAARRRTEGADA